MFDTIAAPAGIRVLDRTRARTQHAAGLRVTRWAQFDLEDQLPFQAMWYAVPPSGSTHQDRHPEAELSLVVTGTAAVEALGGVVEVRQGEAFLLPAGEPHVVHNRSATPSSSSSARTGSRPPPRPLTRGRCPMSTDVFVIVQPTVNGPCTWATCPVPTWRRRRDPRGPAAGGRRPRPRRCRQAPELRALPGPRSWASAADEVAETFRGRILDAFGSARIGWDTFLDPVRDAEFGPAVARLLTELLASDAVELRPTRAAPVLRLRVHAAPRHRRRDLLLRCGGERRVVRGLRRVHLRRDAHRRDLRPLRRAPEAFRATVPVLVLERLRDQLAPLWLAADLPPRVRALLRRYLAEGLPEIPLAYPSDWGIEADGPLAGLRIDVYAELALGYLHGVAAAVAGTPVAGLADVRAAWDGGVRDFWQFHGIDNTSTSPS